MLKALAFPIPIGATVLFLSSCLIEEDPYGRRYARYCYADWQCPDTTYCGRDGYCHVPTRTGGRSPVKDDDREDEVEAPCGGAPGTDDGEPAVGGAHALAGSAGKHDSVGGNTATSGAGGTSATSSAGATTAGSPSASGGAPNGTAGTSSHTSGAGGEETSCELPSCCDSAACHPPEEPACHFSAECGATGRCRDGVCESACESDGDCGTGQRCAGAFCVKDPTPRGDCVYNRDCPQSGQVCMNGTCYAGCRADADCGARDRCLAGVCQADQRPSPQCRNDADCAPGQSCLNAVCRTYCANDDDCRDCGAATVCHAGTCMTLGEVEPECRRSHDCGAERSCIDALCVE